MPAVITVPMLQKDTIAYFTFKEPFAKTIFSKYNIKTTKIKAEVIGITSLKDIVRLNKRDPFSDIYSPAGLSEVEFKQDTLDDIPLVTFSYTDDRGMENLFRVPLNYVDSYSDISSIDYSNRVIVANLGMLPDGMDISGFYSDFADYVATRLGVVPDIKDVTTGEIEQVSVEEYQIREAARNNTVIVRKTLATQLEEKSLALNQILERLKVLGISLGD